MDWLGIGAHRHELSLRALRPDLRVLYMSGYTGNVAMRGGELDLGAGFVQKPITPSALLHAVAEPLA